MSQDRATATAEQQRSLYTAAAWTSLSARLGQFVDTLTPRRDVIARIGVEATPVLGDGRPAGAFNHNTATVTIDASQTLASGDDPSRIDLRDQRDCARFPVLAGVAAHEIGHATHTVNRGAQPPLAATWASVLEEPRMEGRVVASNRRTRVWLRASATQILGDLNPTSASEAARVLILLGGRVDAGVYEADALPDLRALAAPHLEDDDIDVIVEQTRIAVSIDDGDVAGLMECAQMVAAVMSRYESGEQDDTGEGSEDDGADGAPGSGGRVGQPDSGGGDLVEHEDDDGPSPAGHRTGASETDSGAEAASAGRVLAAALAAMAAGAAADARTAAGVAIVSRAAQERRRTEQDHRDKVVAAGRIANSTNHKTANRPASADELAASRRFNLALAAAADRGITATSVKHLAPPGKMQMSQLVRRAAQIEAGQMPTATPWSRTQRRVAETPPLNIGIALDISPSMTASVEPTAVAGWMLARAARARRGRAATVTWHSTAAVHPTTGDTTVHVPDVDGGSDGLPTALRALDARLHLTSSAEPALIAVVTDADLPNMVDVHRQVRRLTDFGVKVLWLTVPGDWSTTPGPPPPTALHAHLDDPSRIGQVLTDAVIAALRAA